MLYTAGITHELRQAQAGCLSWISLDFCEKNEPNIGLRSSYWKPPQSIIFFWYFIIFGYTVACNFAGYFFIWQYFNLSVQLSPFYFTIFIRTIVVVVNAKITYKLKYVKISYSFYREIYIKFIGGLKARKFGKRKSNTSLIKCNWKVTALEQVER